MYVEAKTTITAHFEDAAEAFQLAEDGINDEGPMLQSFLNGAGKEFKEQLGEMANNLAQDCNSEIYQEYIDLQNKVSEGKKVDKTLNELETSYKTNIIKSESLAQENKEKRAMVNARVEHLQKAGINVKANERYNLTDVLTQIGQKRLAEGEAINTIQDQITSLNSEMAAQEKIEKGKIDSLSEMINKNGQQIAELEEKAALIDGFANTRQYLVDQQQDMLKGMDKAAKACSALLPKRAFTDTAAKFKQIKENILVKSNGKMSIEFKNMYDALDNVIDALDKNDQGRSILGMGELQQKTKQYIDAKNSQFRPKLFSSEQRFIRLSGAHDISELIPSAAEMISKIAINPEQLQTIKFIQSNLKDNYTQYNPDVMFNNHLSRIIPQNQKTMQQQAKPQQVVNKNQTSNLSL